MPYHLYQCSNNTNKLSPQEPVFKRNVLQGGSNNTNKLSPQEQDDLGMDHSPVQIIQINLVLKNLILANLNTPLFK